MDMTNNNDDLGGSNYQGYAPPPDSLKPLSTMIRYAAITVAACGLASFVSTLMVFTSLLYRLLTWHSRSQNVLLRSQFVILFLNLVFADLCQAVAFVMSWYWFAKDAILAPSAVCTAQGFLINIGDVASAFYVLFIAIHTFITAARGIRVAYFHFYLAIGTAWLLAFLLTIIGYGKHREKYFVRVAGWCWISHEFEPERLGLHYFWVFLSEFGLMIVYLATFVQLRRETSELYAEQRRASHELANKDTFNAVKRVTQLMVLYPFVYVVLTLPISVCRMWSMAHGGQPVSEITQIIVGGLLASCGWVDCLLYSLTRKRLMRETLGRGSSTSTGSGEPFSHDGIPLKRPDAIMQTSTWEVRRESYAGEDIPLPAVYSEVSSSDLRSRARTRDEAAAGGQDRSPSPFSLPGPAVAPAASAERSLRRKKAFALLPASRSKADVTEEN